ncbi:hypothetical protein NQ315_015383 [Exocentrus adspersus]|uniref:Uncharacterized protein n=1 Tax=Exocentrus adspersus TaxID=1586481 RepID=A0AAV8VKE5_9CUCU|nr:hypothetical protein NQ315_015383 [Exocentrus adspersus]
MAQNEWILTHPGTTLTIYQIAENVNKAFLNSFTPKNIISGFTSSGIYPLNRSVFSADDFLCSYVTDHSVPSISTPTIEEVRGSVPLATNNGDAQTSTKSDTSLISPETILPYPKAPTRKENYKGRKRGSTRILTETPEMNQLKEEHLAKLEKNRQKEAKRKKTVRKIMQESSSDSGEEECYVTLTILMNFMRRCLEQVMKKMTDFSTKKNKISYIGCVENKTDNEYKINFLRRFGNSDKFVYPLEEDICTIERSQILRKLPQPDRNAATARTQATLRFNIEFRKYEKLYAGSAKEKEHQIRIRNNSRIAAQLSNMNLDYHQDTTAELFENWFKNSLLVNIPKNSINVMDNAIYHSRLLNKVPNATNTKVEIMECCSYKKRQLLQVLGAFNIKKEYVCDRVAEEMGHTLKVLSDLPEDT